MKRGEADGSSGDEDRACQRKFAATACVDLGMAKYLRERNGGSSHHGKLQGVLVKFDFKTTILLQPLKNLEGNRGYAFGILYQRPLAISRSRRSLALSVLGEAADCVMPAHDRQAATAAQHFLLVSISNHGGATLKLGYLQ